MSLRRAAVARLGRIVRRLAEIASILMLISTVARGQSTAPLSAGITVVPNSIRTGENATLIWSSTGGTSVTINDGTTTQTVAAQGTQTVSPAQSTKYTLLVQASALGKAATTPGATATAATTLSVLTAAPPTIGTFVATPASISAGKAVTLSWTSSGGTSATIDNLVGSVSPAGGSKMVLPSTTTIYTLTVSTPAGGVATRSVTVNVTVTGLFGPHIIAPTPSVITVAGTGQPGSNDGPSKGAASFMKPFAVAVAPHTAVQATQNLLQNPSFTGSLAGWTLAPGAGLTAQWSSLDATGGSGGSALLVGTNISGCQSPLYQSVSVTPGTTYVLGGSIKIVAGCTGCTAAVFVLWNNGTSAKASYTGITDGFYYESTTVMPPANTTSAFVGVGICNGTTTAYFDDLSFSPVTGAAAIGVTSASTPRVASTESAMAWQRAADEASSYDMLVLDSNHTIRRILPDGKTETWAGRAGVQGHDNGYRTSATFDFSNYIGGIVANADGSVEVVDANGLQRHISASGNVTNKLLPNGNPCTSCVRYPLPKGLVLLRDGTTFVSQGNDTIIRTSPTGVTTVIGRAGQPGPAALEPVAYDQAQFNGPGGMTIDTAGNVYVLDTGNNAIRKISTPDLVVSTMTVSTGGGDLVLGCCASGIAPAPGGGVYVTDPGSNTVKQVGSDGSITTVVGSGSSGSSDGSGSSAAFNGPLGMTTAPDGSIVVTDTNNNTVRSVSVQPQSCVPDAKTACMLNGRFKAMVRYRMAFDDGTPDTDALVKAVTGFANSNYETAFFYFNDSNNIELALKCLDQGNVDAQGNPTIAVLFGTATPLRVQLTIVDTKTGSSKIYESRFGKMQGGTDFTAFIKWWSSGLTSLWWRSGSYGATAYLAAELPQEAIPTAGCIPDSKTACMLNGRFKATIRFRSMFDNAAADTNALAKSVTGFANSNYETAFFYFNDPNNIEVLLKMLDQGNVDAQGNPTIAVLFGTATPLRTEISITDSQTGVTKTYRSDFGQMQGVTDFTAFVKGH